MMPEGTNQSSNKSVKPPRIMNADISVQIKGEYGPEPHVLANAYPKPQ